MRCEHFKLYVFRSNVINFHIKLSLHLCFVQVTATVWGGAGGFSGGGGGGITSSAPSQVNSIVVIIVIIIMIIIPGHDPGGSSGWGP